MLQTTEYGINMWKLYNPANGQTAMIIRRHDYNVRTGGYGMFYAEKNGLDIKSVSGCGFSSYGEAEEAVKNALR